MERFFNMDNRFFSFMGRVADLMILNILCIVCCIPIFTAGASITAMFYVTMKMVRNEESYIVRGFFKSFKENFKQSVAINLIMLVTALLIGFDIAVAQNMSGTAGSVLFTIFVIILIVYLMIFIYIYPLLAKFYNTVKNTFINAFLMSIRHLPYTLLMAVVSALPLCIFLIGNSSVVSMIMLFLVLMGASTIAYINSIFFVKIFDNYIPKEEDEAEKTDGDEKLPGEAAERIAEAGDGRETMTETAESVAATEIPDGAGAAVRLPETDETDDADPASDAPEPTGSNETASDADTPNPEISADTPQEDSSL